MSTNSDNVIVNLSTGVKIPLRPAMTKSNDVYHAVQKRQDDGTFKPTGNLGVLVAPQVVGGGLPTHVTLEGTRIPAIQSETESGKKKVTFNAPVKMDGCTRYLKLNITAQDDGTFRVSGGLSRIRKAAAKKGKQVATEL